MIPVDTTRFQPIASGIVAPVVEWTEVDGKRRPSDVQATSEAGVPLWTVEILRVVREFGKDRTVSIPVEVGSRTAPEVQSLTPIVFKNLAVDFYVKRGGGLGESWSADEIVVADSLDEVLNG